MITIKKKKGNPLLGQEITLQHIIQFTGIGIAGRNTRHTHDIQLYLEKKDKANSKILLKGQSFDWSC